ncbi:CocE/NonD family hydrolase [Myxococcota bacterium]|nr:CocE/NonD family hydrolase [Myxococcota bacterium]MBU1382720.1 CocE/NonD family hydrolase [Myxococcota bacterium]MBU1498403.1 CocE/NonD family hydrolase [Myxococcota bacterium]
MKLFIIFTVLFLAFSGCDDTSSAENNNNLNNSNNSNNSNNINNDAGPDADGGSDDCSEHAFTDVMIPTSDGYELSAFVRKPLNPDCRLPTILIQTPYNKENARSIWFLFGGEPLFDSRDYNFVVMDWRGFFGSAGVPVSNDRDLGYDGADAVDWITAQDWSDGKVGTWGVSALCKIQYQTAQIKPSGLKAMVPIFCGMNQTWEEHYPGGVLRREYINFMEMYYGVSASVYEAHPYRDTLWAWLEGQYSYTKVEAPSLVVAGWYDLNNKGGIGDWLSLRTQSAQAVRDKHQLLIGPWIHQATGGETSMGRPLTDQEKKYVDSSKIIQERSLAFFNVHLREIGESQAQKVEYIVDNETTPRFSDTWPPTVNTQVVYLRENTLSDEAPTTETDRVFSSDPDDPSPTIGGQTLMGNYHHGPQYLDEIIARSDSLVYESSVAPGFIVGGEVVVTLEIETDVPDTDIAVRITAVDPQGRHLLIAEGIQRLKLRDSNSTPSLLTAAQLYTVNIKAVNHHGYAFPAGWRLGLIITGSNFERFDVNPNTGNDFLSEAPAPAVSTTTIYAGGISSITFSTVE